MHSRTRDGGESPTAHAQPHHAHSSLQDKRASFVANAQMPVAVHASADPSNGVHGKDKALVSSTVLGYEVPASEQLRLQQQRIAPSYATQAYRDFISQSNNASAAQSRSHSRRSSISSVSGHGSSNGMESAFGSASSSVQSSAASSMAPSGASTQQHSRTTSPTAALHDHQSATAAYSHAAREGAPHHQQQQHHSHAHHSTSDSMAYPTSHSLNVSHLSHVHGASLGQGQLSLASLKPSLPEDDEDSDVDRSVRLPARAVLRPRHFTFAESDVLKSLKRAQERDRERARIEREAEQAREAAALHAAREQQERERQRALELQQHQREQAARDIAFKLSLQRQELDRQRRLESADSYSTSDASASTSGGSSDSPIVRGERAHSPRPPSHFRFDTHDIRKSYSKPSQRQAIGHWTTFPRSSTIMYATHQLKALIAHRQQEIEAKMQSAPTSPQRMHTHDGNGHAMHHQHHGSAAQQSIRQNMGEAKGSFSSRDPANRRASMPSAISSVQLPAVTAAAPAPAASTAMHPPAASNHAKHTLSAPHLAPLEARSVAPVPAAAAVTPVRSMSASKLPRATHSRSSTLGSLPLEKLRAHAQEFDKPVESASSAYQKQYPTLSSHQTHEQNSHIRRLDRVGAHTRGLSAGSSLEALNRFTDSATAAASAAVGAGAGSAGRRPVKAVPLHAPVQHLSTGAAAAVDARARRAQQLQPHVLQRPSSHYLSNSAPSSPARQAVRLASARNRLHQQQQQQSTPAGAVRGGSAGSVALPLSARRAAAAAALNASESKSASANSSPVMPLRSRLTNRGPSSSSAGLMTGDFSLPLLMHDKLVTADAWSGQAQPKPAATASSTAYAHGNMQHYAARR